jgi:hypothetical protein
MSKALIEEHTQRQQKLDRRFFAMADSRTGKATSTWNASGAMSPDGAMDKPRGTTTFLELGMKFARSPIDRTIVNARQQQLMSVSRNVLSPARETGWMVMHKRSADANFENTEGIELRCHRVEEAIQRVNRQMVQGGFPAFLMATGSDQLVYDRKVMVTPRRDNGEIISYWPLDPTTVLPRAEVLAPFMMQMGSAFGYNADAVAAAVSYQMYNDGARDMTGGPIDLTRAAYVQKIDGRVVGAWTTDEIDVDITMPSTAVDHLFYGESCFEKSITITDAIIAAFEYNSGWFRSRVPEQLVFLGGDVDPIGLDEFQKRLYAGMQPGDFHRVAFLPGDPDFKIQAMPLRQTMREMAFPAWIRLLIAMKCAAYRMDPRIINFDVATGNDQQLWKSSSREMQLTLSQEEGFHTLVMNMENWLQRTIVDRMDPDLMIRWVGLDKPSETDQVELLNAKLQHASLNEVRAQTGELKPMEIPGYPGLADIPQAALAGMLQMEQIKQIRQQGTMMEAQMQAPQQQPSSSPSDALRNNNSGSPSSTSPQVQKSFTVTTVDG